MVSETHPSVLQISPLTVVLKRHPISAGTSETPKSSTSNVILTSYVISDPSADPGNVASSSAEFLPVVLSACPLSPAKSIILNFVGWKIPQLDQCVAAITHQSEGSSSDDKPLHAASAELSS